MLIYESDFIKMALRKKKVADNPNPRANIGFLCYVPLNYFVYKNIYKHLPNSEFIVGEPYYLQPKDSLKNLVDFFSKKKDVYWRFIDYENMELTENEFYSKYGLLVSTWYFKLLAEPYIQSKKLVRVLYGHAKDPWNFGLWSGFFDLVLSYGKYSQKYLSEYGNSTIVGNPKFDDWFKNQIDKNELKRLAAKLDPNKKTILYLPTYGGLGSFELMSTAMAEASLKYNVIVKLHHNTNLSEKLIVDSYKNTKIILKNDQDDILVLFKASDFVIGDNSGSIIEAILADKKIIQIDFLDSNFFKTYNENIYYKIEEKYLGAITSIDSLEQLIKKEEFEVGPVIKLNPVQQKQIAFVQIKEAIGLAMAKETTYKKRRGKIKAMAFANCDGTSGKRAAEKIKKLLYGKKPDPSFISEQIRRYDEYFVNQNKNKYRPNPFKKVESFQTIRSMPFLERVGKVIKEFFF